MVSHGYTWFQKLHEVHGFTWFHMVVRVTKGHMVTCGSARLQGFLEVTWFHVVTHGS